MRTITSIILFIAALAATGCTAGTSGSPAPVADELKLEFDGTDLRRSAQLNHVSYADVLDNAQKAVVSVYASKLVNVYYRQSPFSQLRRRLLGQQDPRVIQSEQQEIPQGMGSGVIVSNDGYILTNNHVVTDNEGNDADEIQVKLSDGTEYEAELVGRDPQTDIAVLKITASKLPVVPLANSDNVRVGDVSFAIGNPLNVGLTVTSGIVSATGRSIDIIEGGAGYEDFIQTDASINPGNSGGALIDAQGRLIGVNSAILSMTGSNIGIGFAIPSNLAVHVLRQIVEFGEVRRGILGISMSIEEQDNKDGVLIKGATAGMPAATAGIKPGDRIVAINDTEVKNYKDFRLILGRVSPGNTVTLSIKRDGSTLNTDVTLASEEDMRGPFFGGIFVELIDLSNIIKGVSAGLRVHSLDHNSPVRQSFRPGMVILQINDHPVSNVTASRDLLRNGNNSFKLYDPYRQSIYNINVRIAK